MALTKDQAKAITETVSKDEESKGRIQSWVAVLPDSWGWAGIIRNFGFSLAVTYTPVRYDKWDHLVCTGIAAASCNAINNSRPAAIRRADSVDRLEPFPHTATLVEMSDGSSYVFDWWVTLNVDNPMIFPSVALWMLKRGGVTLENFDGWE